MSWPATNSTVPAEFVADRLGERDRLLAHGAPRLLVEQRRGRLLDHLLIAALDRAFALAEVDDVAVLVADELDLDVARIDDELLDEHAIIAEGGLGLRARQRKAFLDLLARKGDAHALAAATRGGLHHHRIADLLGDLDGVLGVADLAHVARDGRDLGGGSRLLALDLVAHGGDRLGVGADEDDAGLGQRHGKGLAFRQEAVAGVHRLRARRLAGLDDLVDQQVGLRRRRRPDVHGLVRHIDVEGVAVGIGIDRDGLDSHFPRGLDDAASYLATVCNQDLFEHCPFWPSWPGDPLEGRRSMLVLRRSRRPATPRKLG